MTNKIKLKRGNKIDLPQLDCGEPALCIDTKEIFIGTTDGNIELAQTDYVDAKIASIIQTGGEITEIVDNLLSDRTDMALSANQGRVISEMLQLDFSSVPTITSYAQALQAMWYALFPSTSVTPSEEPLALVPNMTSNTTPNGTAVSSGSPNGASTYYHAFWYGSDMSWATSNIMPCWIGYIFPSAKTVNYFTIYQASWVGRRQPKTFTLQGTNNGTTWTDIQSYTTTYTGGSDSDTNAVIQNYTYNVDTPASYLGYRLYITGSNGYAGNGTAITELQFYGYTRTQLYLYDTGNEYVNYTNGFNANDCYVGAATYGTVTKSSSHIELVSNNSGKQSLISTSTALDITNYNTLTLEFSTGTYNESVNGGIVLCLTKDKAKNIISDNASQIYINLATSEKVSANKDFAITLDIGGLSGNYFVVVRNNVDSSTNNTVRVKKIYMD